jgi:hypothetical protein
MDLIEGLKYLATFTCQHEDSCDDVQRIPLCNSCSASAWAKAQLAELNSGADRIMEMARNMLRGADASEETVDPLTAPGAEYRATVYPDPPADEIE